jgi:hypothetical protein
MASFSVGILIGPAIGSMLTPLTATYGACVCGLLCIVYVYFFVPESLSQQAMEEVSQPTSCTTAAQIRSTTCMLQATAFYFARGLTVLTHLPFSRFVHLLTTGTAAAGQQQCQVTRTLDWVAHPFPLETLQAVDGVSVDQYSRPKWLAACCDAKLHK